MEWYQMGNLGSAVQGSTFRVERQTTGSYQRDDVFIVYIVLFPQWVAMDIMDLDQHNKQFQIDVTFEP
jgi:hypothetical protein